MFASDTRAAALWRLVRSLDSAPTLEAAVAHFATFLDAAGMSHFACLHVAEFDAEPEVSILVDRLPKGLIEPLVDHHALQHDVHLRELIETFQPLTWPADDATQVRCSMASGPVGGFAVAAIAAGIPTGLLLPLAETTGLMGLVVLGRSEPPALEVECAHLKLASYYFFGRANILRRRAVAESARLTAREFECVKWVAAGKTDWEIGQILGISQKTVNYHIENVKRKFGVQTRVQAVVAAIRSGSVLV